MAVRRGLILSFILVCASGASAEEPKAESSDAASAATKAPTIVGSKFAPAVPVHPKRGYTLRECLDLAEKNYPKIREASAQLSRMRAQIWEAKTTAYGGFTATAGIGIAPTVFGTALYSPSTDTALTSNMALAWRFGVEGAIPLWTFGKISNAVDAAVYQEKVGEHQVKKAKNEIRMSVRQAFYGVLLARDARALLDEAIARVDKYLPGAEEKVRSGDGDDIQLLKLKMQRSELIARRSESARQESIALAGLRFFTASGAELDVPDMPLRRVAQNLGPLSTYLTAARLFRPEINMAHAGVLARKALLALERSRYYPDLGLALSFSESYAPEVSDQLNPFVRDEANYLRYGAALALKWNLDFLPRAAKVAQAEAQLEEIRATEQYALGGIGVEVETAYAEARDAAARLEAYGDSARYAKQWLVKVQQGIDVGTFEEDDIVDPGKEYALRRFFQMSATLDYNVAMSKLALATGWDAVAPVE